jgi:hypothetical protein
MRNYVTTISCVGNSINPLLVVIANAPDYTEAIESRV